MVGDLDAALTGDTLVHPESGADSNVYCTLKIRKGDVGAGFDAADVVVEGMYEVPYQEHAYLQPEAAVTYIDDEGRVTVEVAGQWTHEDREQIAHALDLPLDQVRVIYPAIGGAFGGREDMSIQIVMALAALRLAEQGERRPIATMWSREESIVGHHKRHRGRIHTRWGATRDGKITAVEATVHLDAGAYNYTTNKVLGNCHLSVVGPYEIPNATIDSYGVYTNAVPGGAFRGFGAPQGIFVAETQMNKIAARLGLDPVELRRRNVIHDGSIGITQTPYPLGVTMPEVLDSCVSASGWDEPLVVIATVQPVRQPCRRVSRRCATGAASPVLSRTSVSASASPSGVKRRSCCTVTVSVPIESSCSTAAPTSVRAPTRRSCRWPPRRPVLPVEAVSGTFSDTATTGDSGSASASRLTWMAGNSILGAAEEADKAWRDGDRPAVGSFRFVPPPTEALDPDTGVAVPNFSYGYTAQVVELSVDVETGHIVVDRVVSTHDVGKAINPTLVDGQIEGAVVQGHGYALSENLAGGRRKDRQPTVLPVPDPRHRRHPSHGGQRRPRARRPARAVGRAGHGGDAADPVRRGRGRCRARRDGRVVRRVPAHSRSCPGEAARERFADAEFRLIRLAA